MLSARTLPFALLVAGLAVMGCRDTAPTGATPGLAKGGKITTITSSTSGTVNFTIYPHSQTTVVVGEHKIVFEKDAVCEPATANYGNAPWTSPCSVARGGVKITAKYWTDALGQPMVDFQPALRFSPASEVTLYMKDKEASAIALSKAIYYVNNRGLLVDEAATDPSVATKVGSNGFMYRRIRHFSGYTLSTGRSSTESEAY